MDKIVTILENYHEVPCCIWETLNSICDDYDITPEDVLTALEDTGCLDIDEIYARVAHGIEDE